VTLCFQCAVYKLIYLLYLLTRICSRPIAVSAVHIHFSVV